MTEIKKFSVDLKKHATEIIKDDKKINNEKKEMHWETESYNKKDSVISAKRSFMMLMIGVIIAMMIAIMIAMVRT